MRILRKRLKRNHAPIRDVFRVLGLLLFWLILGVLMYRYLEGWGWLDAFYMAVITLSTVGYTEAQPLSDLGRIFTSIYIVGGAFTSVYTLARIGQFIFEGELSDVLENRYMNKQLNEKKDHTIICGYGRLSKSILDGFEDTNDLILIDRNHELESQFQEMGISYIIGDATDEDVLRRAGVERASSLLAMISSDADNLYITIATRELNKDIQLIACCMTDSAEKRLYRGGADDVISPYKITGQHILNKIG